MIILLSPAKSLDFTSSLPAGHQQLPLGQSPFAEQSDRLVRSLSRMSKKRLEEIMPVSDNLIELNYRRYRDFQDQPEKSAIHAFNGDVYTGFEAETLEPESLKFAERHLRILSGLYGLLKPMDAIRPYRLEMGTRWAPRHKSLIGFWGDKISDLLSEQLDQMASDTIINLASNEYFAAVEKGLNKRNLRIINVDFNENGPDGPHFISFSAKRARGMAARYMCEHHYDRAEALKGFDYDGYQFVADDSSENSWRFLRNS